MVYKLIRAWLLDTQLYKYCVLDLLMLFLTFYLFYYSDFIGACHPSRKDHDLDYDIENDAEWEELYHGSLFIQKIVGTD